MSDTPLTGYPSIDKPWLKYYSKEAINAPLPKCSIYEYLWENNKDHVNDVALIYFGQKISYRKLFANVEQVTKAFWHLGIKSGDCVTLCTAGIPEAIYIVLACSKIGVLANFINPLFTEEQMIDRINDTEAKWIFVLDEMYSRVEAALTQTCIQNTVIIPITNSFSAPLAKLLYVKSKAHNIIRREKHSKAVHLLWADFIKKNADISESPAVPYTPDTPAIMVYSSGSTGASKGIVLTNDAATATIMDSLSAGFSYERGKLFLQMIPVWFSTGIIQSVLLPLNFGVAVILEPLFNAPTFVKDVMKYKPCFTLVATSIWLAAVKDKSFSKANLSYLQYPFTGGEKVIPQSEREINDFLNACSCPSPLLKGYGMCELGGKVTDSVLANREGSVGIPMAHITVGIFDSITNKEVTYRKHGEIRVITPAHMKEYYKNKKATEEYFWTDTTGKTWGCTGDIGYIDEEGLLYVLGRATDAFHLSSGEVVYLFDIEEEIIKDEFVAQCKVVDINTGSGIKLVAHIVFRADAENIFERLYTIHERIRAVLPEYMVPNFYKVRDSIPVHSNGKRDIDTLRKDCEELISTEEINRA